MIEAIKGYILAYPFSRKALRYFILFFRKQRALIFGKGRVSRLVALLIVRIYKSKGWLARSVAKSSNFRAFLGGKSRASRIFFSQFKDFAWKANNATFLYHLATIYRMKKDYSSAFEVFFHLFKVKHNLNHCLRAMTCEIHLKDKLLYKYYEANKGSLPKNVALIMECEYSQYYDSVEVRWDEVRASIAQTFFLPLVNKSLLSALAAGNIDFIRCVEAEILSRLSDENKEYLRRTLTVLAACYYRMGLLWELRSLGEKVSYSNSDWKLYMAFGVGDLMEVMSHRGATIKNSFSLYYPHVKRKINKYVLVPEKDLCGEAFNALFYPSILSDKGGFTVVCDARLHNLMSSNFKGIEFVAKTPRYLASKRVSDFDILPYNLSDYLDNLSYKATLGAEFFTINYSKYFSTESCQVRRLSGWLTPDPKLVNFWISAFSIFEGKRLIGFCANSTVRSRIRDMHMVSLDNWGDIFSLSGSVFVNLNAALGEADCLAISHRFGVEIFNPDFDLYNDFDNLIALMSVLDFGVLPANNLMDFAAAVGLKSIVFSPSNIMRSWVLEGENTYVFSKNIRFVLPDSPSEDVKDLVRKGAEMIGFGF